MSRTAANTTGERMDRVAMVAGPLVLIVLVTWLAGLTSQDRPHALADTLRVLATSLPFAAGWLIGAMGVGRLLRPLVAPDSPDALAIQVHKK